MVAAAGRIGPALASGVLFLAFAIASAEPLALPDQGYRDMYDLNFSGAHRTFGDWEKSHPSDPMGPVSDAAPQK